MVCEPRRRHWACRKPDLQESDPKESDPPGGDIPPCRCPERSSRLLRRPTRYRPTIGLTAVGVSRFLRRLGSLGCPEFLRYLGFQGHPGGSGERHCSTWLILLPWLMMPRVVRPDAMKDAEALLGHTRSTRAPRRR